MQVVPITAAVASLKRDAPASIEPIPPPTKRAAIAIPGAMPIPAKRPAKHRALSLIAPLVGQHLKGMSAASAMAIRSAEGWTVLVCCAKHNKLVDNLVRMAMPEAPVALVHGVGEHIPGSAAAVVTS